MNKRQRQYLIRRIVKEEEIASQSELVERLSALGCRVTQATISRDLRELGLQKSRDRTGKVRYTIAVDAEERPDPASVCARMLKEFARLIDTAQNLVVVRCDPGTAPGLARAIDELDHELIVGSVAGDDTILVVCKDGQSAATVHAYLSSLGG
ncbi:MAG: arginine repressor [Thermoleophilia bacterium]|nr:arginine repressor [Thermoleophilia bacterium]